MASISFLYFYPMAFFILFFLFESSSIMEEQVSSLEILELIVYFLSMISMMEV